MVTPAPLSFLELHHSQRQTGNRTTATVFGDLGGDIHHISYKNVSNSGITASAWSASTIPSLASSHPSDRQCRNPSAPYKHDPSVRRHLRRMVYQGHGGVRFNPPARTRNS
ncbi:TonB-dependent siderophore receptor [Novosphingobium sp. Rr 2-17]|uniref:hypothetical protein n=1 Tax=Novosphingobium sp. Rr 2-17 TaxID=555793 RepID=UPI0002698584|nr:hypothetical protein [Novosphingobium sp. Rr 2-17]EIZ77744.1 TonB-dependent siderophore receptor [Novosphingobium sp. Rr 2-17]